MDGETLWLIDGLLLFPCRAAGALPPEKGGTAGSKRSEERCPAAFVAALVAYHRLEELIGRPFEIGPRRASFQIVVSVALFLLG